MFFWCATQSTLPFGSTDEIRKEGQERLELLSRGSGDVFATIHNILADISPDKIMAVFETAKNFSIKDLIIRSLVNNLEGSKMIIKKRKGFTLIEL